MRAMGRPAATGPNGTCPVCERPILVSRLTPEMILLRPHPQELIQACRNQNGTSHSRAELTRALERRRREGPQTYTQGMADLEEQLRKGD
jgi:hypothetical protein